MVCPREGGGARWPKVGETDRAEERVRTEEAQDARRCREEGRRRTEEARAGAKARRRRHGEGWRTTDTRVTGHCRR